MSRTVFDEVFRDGALVSSTAREVSDEHDRRDEAHGRLTAAYERLRGVADGDEAHTAMGVGELHDLLADLIHHAGLAPQ